MNISGKNPELLKVTAVLFMVIDHVGALLNDNIFMRGLGRFALPLFIFQLVYGFTVSNNKNRNFKLLLIFSIISYFPYNIFIYGDYINNLVNDFEIKGSWNVFLPLTITYYCLILLKDNNKPALILMLLISMFIFFLSVGDNFTSFAPKICPKIKITEITKITFTFIFSSLTHFLLVLIPLIFLLYP